MSNEGVTRFDKAHENQDSQEFHDSRNQHIDICNVDRAGKRREGRESSLEPLSVVAEVSVTPSVILDDASERTITPPYMRRYALPIETRIDRNVTRKRGTAAARERFHLSFTTDSQSKLHPLRDEGHDLTFGHSPLRSKDNFSSVEERVPDPPHIVITGVEASEQTEQVSAPKPTYISTGIFNPSRATAQRDISLPLIPLERSEVSLETGEQWKSVSVSTEPEKASKPKHWDFGVSNFPPIRPRDGKGLTSQIPTSSASEGLSGIKPIQPVYTTGTQVSRTLPETGVGLPGYITRRHTPVWRPPLPLDPPPSLPKQPPPPRDLPDPYLDDTEEYTAPELEVDDEEEENKSQYSEGQEVGDLRELIDKLTIGDEAEPEDHTELINQTLEESKNVDKVLEEISEYRQRFVKRGVDDPEESIKSVTSDTDLKKPGTEEKGIVISHQERVLLSKLHATNQRLCKVTQLWKETERQAAYLSQHNHRLEGEIAQRDTYFESISKKNIQDRYEGEQELKVTINNQLQQINSLNAEKVRLEQVCNKERTDKSDWCDLTKELQAKIARLTAAGIKNTAELQEIAHTQEERIATQEHQKIDLQKELHDLYEKHIAIREQLTLETVQRERVERELNALLITVDRDSKKSSQRAESGDIGIQRRLSSTAIPQAGEASVFEDAIEREISPIPHERVTKKRVGFESELKAEGDKPDIIDILGLGLGETVLSNIWKTNKTEQIHKNTAEKPFEESERQSTTPKSRLEPFQDLQIPGRVRHWDVFGKSGGSVSDTVTSVPTESVKSRLPSEGDEEEGRSYRFPRLSPLPIFEDQRDQEGQEDNNMPNFDLMTKLSKPVPFSGRDYESGREWLRRFDAYCISGGFDPHTVPPGSDQDGKFRAGMIGLLQGAAGVWLDSLPDTQRETYTALRKAFEDRWVLPYLTGTRLAEETRLAGRIQQAHESCESLYQDLAQMCHKMGKGEQDLMIHFVRNLRPEIQDRVVTGCPKDMMTALQMAQAAEARLGMTASAPSLTAMIEQNPHLAAMQKELNDLKNRQEQLKEERKPVCSYCQKPGHSQADCRIYKKDREQEVPQQNQPKPKQQQNKKFNGQCFNCKQKGHMSKDCRQPRKTGEAKDHGSTIEDLKKRLAELESKQKDQSPK